MERSWERLFQVTGDEQGVSGVRLKDEKTGDIEALSLHGCFVAIGHHPNTDIFKGKLDMKDGYLITRSGLQGLTAH